MPRPAPAAPWSGCDSSSRPRRRSSRRHSCVRRQDPSDRGGSLSPGPWPPARSRTCRNGSSAPAVRHRLRGSPERLRVPQQVRVLLPELTHHLRIAARERSLGEPHRYSHPGIFWSAAFPARDSLLVPAIGPHCTVTLTVFAVIPPADNTTLTLPAPTSDCGISTLIWSSPGNPPPGPA